MRSIQFWIIIIDGCWNQYMQYLIGVCTVCATEQSRSQHHVLKHNGRKNLPMSTGCITTTLINHEHWTLVLRKHVLHNYRSQRSWNSKPEPYHEQAWTNQGHWVHIVIRKKSIWTVSHRTGRLGIKISNQMHNS